MIHATNTNAIATVGIQKGDVTHHQDQSITWHNFSMMNATPNRPIIGVLIELSLFIIFDLNVCIHFF